MGGDGSVSDSPADTADSNVPPPLAVGTYKWAAHYGPTNSGTAGVTVDKDGNTIIVTNISGPITVALDDGGMTTLNPSASDVAVIKLDPQGKGVWAKVFGAASAETARAVAVDANGDVYVAGDTNGTFAFGASTVGVASHTTGFVVKFTAAGTATWGSTFGNVSSTAFACSALSAKATTVVVGCTFAGSGDYQGPAGNVTVSQIGGAHDILVVKLAQADGKGAWGAKIGGAADDSVSGLAVDDAGDAWMAATFTSLDALQGVGTAPTRVGNGQNVLVAKLSGGNGGGLLSVAYGDGAGNSAVSAKGIAVGGGIVAIGGSYSGAGANFGLGVLGGGAQGDVFVFAIDPTSKTTLFQKSIGGSAGELGGAVAVDQYARVTVIGTYFSQGLTIDGAPLPNPGGTAEGAFIAKFDRMGTKLWVHGIAGTLTSDAVDGNVVAVAPSGDVVGGGLVQNGADLGSGTRTNTVQGFTSDSFVVGWAQ